MSFQEVFGRTDEFSLFGCIYASCRSAELLAIAVSDLKKHKGFGQRGLICHDQVNFTQSAPVVAFNQSKSRSDKVFQGQLLTLWPFVFSMHFGLFSARPVSGGADFVDRNVPAEPAAGLQPEIAAGTRQCYLTLQVEKG